MSAPDPRGPGAPDDPATARGPIAWMARNSVAANLLMIVIFAVGMLGLGRMKQEVFPAFELDLVTVAVPYPGASPAEVEQGIVLAIEEEVRAIDGVKRVTSTAAEGVGTVAVELQLGVDKDKVLNDVKSAVDRITTFPEDAEKPIVSSSSSRREVISVLLSGDQDLRALHEQGERLRARLLDRPEITQVDLMGVPPLELSIEVSRARLEALGLSLEDVARQLTAASVELPGGEVETRGGELLLRLSDRRLTAETFANLVLISTRDGSQLRLSDVATLRDRYQDTDLAYFYDGKPAVKVTAFRVGDETPRAVATAVKEVAEEFRGEAPASMTVTTWRDDSQILNDRVDLLVRNGQSGLILVVLVLALFLDLRLALWVALGIPLSFAGSFALAPMLGVSINMVSLFALIIVLGVVVDDAIVVAENYHDLVEKGNSRMQAAILGAQQMAVAVTFSVLTTVATFFPLLILPGIFGKIFGIIPLVVISVLIFSLAESFFILPAHLGHGKEGAAPAPGTLRSRFDAPRRVFSAALLRFTEGPYQRFLRASLAWRQLTIAVAMVFLMLTVGVLKAQIVPFSFFPKLEGNTVTVGARLPYGAPEAAVTDVRRSIEDALMATIPEFGAREAVTRGVLTRAGQGLGTGGPGGASGTLGGHLVSFEVELVPTEQREFTSKDFADAWQAKVPPLAGVDALTFNSSSGPGGGAAVDVQLAHPDTAVLARASAELAETLRTYTDLRSVENTYAAGKPQLDFTLRPEARTLGLTAVDVGRQLRAHFFGAEALREQRGRNELRVMVRLPEAERLSEYDVEEVLIRTPTGGFAPLGTVAELRRNRAPTSIEREDGQRTVDVKADLAAGVRSSQDVIASLKADVLPALRARYPDLKAELVGEQREQNESLSSLGSNYLVALFVVYALLAVPFRSYTQPLIIMVAIPFGIVGAVAGHLLLGFELSIISMMGIVALSGVAVNDSLVLIEAINQYRAEGDSPVEAAVRAGIRRMRPILLTSLTTFFGLMPMIFEKSPQARFLIPMAISLGFGVLFTTVIALVLVPSLYLSLEENLAWGRRVWAWARGRMSANTRTPASEDGQPAR